MAIYPDLAGRAALITGGATGIGAALVAAFAAQGARTAILDIDGLEGETTARGHGSMFIQCDVTDPQAVERAVHGVASAFGSIDIVINNAANDVRQAAAGVDAEAWRRSMAVNLDAAFCLCRSAYPTMKERGGVILNISSINAFLAPALLAPYVAAKAALLGLTKSLAREWGDADIRVNAISPGWVVTQRQLDLWLTPEAEAAWMQQVALQRRIMPSDVARLALFLASDEAALITGQNFVIDGGRT